MQTKIDLIEILDQVAENHKGYNITVDGEITERPFDDGEFYNIQSIKKDMGWDYFEIVRLPLDIIIIADEEGLLKNTATVNSIATRIYQEAYKSNQVGIVGNCVICHTSRVKQSIITLGLHYFQKKPQDFFLRFFYRHGIYRAL